MNDELIAEKLIKMAEDYVLLGERGLLQGSNERRPQRPSTVTTFDGKEWLRIQFFFPAIADNACALLSQLRDMQRTFAHHKNVDLDALPATTAVEAAACGEYSEANFEQLKNKVENEMLPSLTPVQQIIVRKVFLTVPETE